MTATGTDIASRLRERFPFAAEVDDHLPDTRGGRAAALAAVDAIDPIDYARSRNHLDGAATRLSPYLRHGVLTLAECRRAALAKVNKPHQAGKLVQELAWRDYFQRVYDVVGEGVWQNIEPWKTGHPDSHYAPELPDDIRAGETGVDYIDHFARELHQTGYLHNHARLWTAAYVVHGRGVHWRAGAQWFLEHLLDGDPASNNLSWQWVASTFGSKPYIYNRGNVIKYSGDRFPQHQRNDPFDDSYENIAARCFGDEHEPDDAAPGHNLKVNAAADAPHRQHHGPAVAFIHNTALSPENPALQRADLGGVWLWDAAAMRRDRHSLKRLVFQGQCLAEMPGVDELTVEDDRPAAALLAEAQRRGAARILSTPCPDPAVKRILAEVQQHLPVDHVQDEPFVDLQGQVDLRRFSRYWRKAEKALA